jgi:hypothetical protein
LNLLLPALAKMLLPSHIEQALLCVRRMALTHFTVAVEHLLSVPLPLPGEAIRMFITIAKTPELVLQLLNTLLSTLNDSPFSEDKPVPVVRAVRPHCHLSVTSWIMRCSVSFILSCISHSWFHHCRQLLR